MAKMTPEEFDALRPRIGRLALDTVQIAREVLVDDDSQADVARRHGISRQRVNSAVNRVIAAANEIPADWERVEVWLPPELAANVRQVEAEARSKLEA